MAVYKVYADEGHGHVTKNGDNAVPMDWEITPLSTREWACSLEPPGGRYERLVHAMPVPMDDHISSHRVNAPVETQ